MEQKRLNFFFSLNSVKKTNKKLGIKQRLCYQKKSPHKNEGNYCIRTENVNLNNNSLFIRVSYCYKNTKVTAFSF